MVSDQTEFQERLRRLVRKHRAMARGYTTRMRSDGLIVAKPRRAVSPISGRSVLIFLLVFLAFKGFLIANLGAAAYSERVERLQSGNFAEQAGAFAMQADPVSKMFADLVAPLLD